MSDDTHRPDSQKSRQELLDEIYLLRDVAGERDQRARDLQRKVSEGDAKLAELRGTLTRVLASRSWRLTAPLRAVTQWIRRIRQPNAPTSATPAFPPLPARERVGERGPGASNPRLFVDITELALRHGKTGVQRVTLEILRALMTAPPAGYVVEPVVAMPDQPYRAAFACHSREGGNPESCSQSDPQGVGPHLPYSDSYDSQITAGEPFSPARGAGALEETVACESGQDGRAPDRGSRASSPHGLQVPHVHHHPRTRYPAIDRGLRFSVSCETPNPARGDIFLGLDHAMHAVAAHADELAAWRKRGVRLWFVCNDTLPLSRPDWFPPEVHASFKAWFTTIARVADGIACISQATEADVRHWVDELQIAREHSLTVGHFHLGADIEWTASDRGVTAEEQIVLDRLRTTPSFLMVGTLEPRKGHAQALAAFNELWQQDEDVALVIVGLPGWMTEVTQRRIRHHDEFGIRLLWFMDASDALLNKLYASCSALLAPSEGEGFGLPLVEAARHGLPILCRDLLVFHEVAGGFATYFSGDDPASLALAVHQWLEHSQQGKVVGTATMPRLSWRQSAQQLVQLVFHDQRSGFSVEDEQGPEHA